VESVKQQLRSLSITSSQEPGKIFLGLDMTRAGYVSKEDLRTACIRNNLPCSDDIIDCVRSLSISNSLIAHHHSFLLAENAFVWLKIAAPGD